MNSNQLKGLPVLTIAGGDKMGTLVRTYVDGPKQKIAGFAFTASGGFLQVESEPKLDTKDVRTVGPDALIISSEDKARGATVNKRAAELLVLDDVASLPVMSEGGVSVGRIATVDFDNHTYALTDIEVSPGLFKANRSIPISQVITIGPDYVIVADSAVQPDVVASTDNSPASASAKDTDTNIETTPARETA